MWLSHLIIFISKNILNIYKQEEEMHTEYGKEKVAAVM